MNSLALNNYRRIARTGYTLTIKTTTNATWRVRLLSDKGEVVAWEDTARNGTMTPVTALERVTLNQWGPKSSMHAVVARLADIAETVAA
jgi:hypothetical protein